MMNQYILRPWTHSRILRSRHLGSSGSDVSSSNNNDYENIVDKIDRWNMNTREKYTIR